MENLSTCLQPSLDSSRSGETPAEDQKRFADGALIVAAAPAALGFARRFSAAELSAVRIASRTARAPAPRMLAITFSWLGNGWIYPVLCAIVLAKWGFAGVRILAPAAASALLLHTVYPPLKRACGRRRPFQVDPELPSLLATLDAHSFPSGHAMTLAGVLTPIVMFWPSATVAAVAMGACVSWSRMATGHHYPSDVLAGLALGIGIGYPVACVVSLWG